MRFDRKLLLIAPAIVLVFVVAGLVYSTMQLHALGQISASLQERSEFIASVERGEKTLETRQSLSLLRWAMDVEAKRTDAIVASRDLLISLSAIALVCCGVLALGIRSVPRQHWPRMSFGRQRTE